MADEYLVTDPFATEAVPEIDLSASPISAAIMQIRFPAEVSAIRTALLDGRLTSALEDSYPYMQKQQELNLMIQVGQQPMAEPVPERTDTTNWAMYSEDRRWTINLTSQFIAITTTDYRSRSEFIDRVRDVIEGIQSKVKAPAASRIGMRYLNQVYGSDLYEWVGKLRPATAGILSELNGEQSEGVGVSLSEIRFQWNDAAGMQARWGIIPAAAVLDVAMKTVPEASWILDIDTFNEESIEFNSTSVTQQTEVLSSRAYRFFRWAVPPEALRRFKPREDE